MPEQKDNKKSSSFTLFLLILLAIAASSIYYFRNIDLSIVFPWAKTMPIDNHTALEDHPSPKEESTIEPKSEIVKMIEPNLEEKNITESSKCMASAYKLVYNFMLNKPLSTELEYLQKLALPKELSPIITMFIEYNNTPTTAKQRIFPKAGSIFEHFIIIEKEDPESIAKNQLKHSILDKLDDYIAVINSEIFYSICIAK